MALLSDDEIGLTFETPAKSSAKSSTLLSDTDIGLTAEPEKPTGWLGDIGNAMGRGFNRLQQTGNVMLREGGIISDESAAEAIARDERDVASYPASEGVDRDLRAIGDSKTWGETLYNVITSPRAIVTIVSESVPASLAVQVGGIAGGVAGGLVSAGGGAVPGVVAGTGATSLATEYSSTILDTMREQGVDVTDPQAVAKAFQDEKLMAEARASGLKRGIPIAVLDAISFGIAGKVSKLVTGGAEAVSTARRVAGEAAEIGAQGALGAGGEAAGQYVDTGEVGQMGDVLLEGAAEGVTGVGEIAAGKAFDRVAELRTQKERGAPNAETNIPTGAADADILFGADPVVAPPPATAQGDAAAQPPAVASSPDPEIDRPDSPRLTPEDRASPLPNNIIDDGKRIIDEALAQAGAKVDQAAQPAQPQQRETASWVIKDKQTGEVIMETFDKRAVDALRTDRFEAVPIQDHLASLNRPAENRADAPVAPPLEEISGQRTETLPPAGNLLPDHDVLTSEKRAVEPTPAQAEAGNYQKRHVNYGGLDISIETEKGGIRRSKPGAPEPWEVTLPAAYGYVKRTTGADGDQLDVYLGPTNADTAFVIDQINPETGAFDEHKAMLGFPNQAAAMEAYNAAFSDGKGPQRAGAVTAMPMFGFKQWLKGDTTQPLSYREGEKGQKPPAEVSGLAAEPPLTVTEVKQRKAGTARNKDIVQFIAAIGGVRDFQGELKSLDLKNRFVPGSGKVVREDGRDLDKVRELAAEAGYFDDIYPTRDDAMADSTVADLLRLIDQNERGQRAFTSDGRRERENIAAETMGNLTSTEQAKQDDYAEMLADVGAKLTEDELAEVRALMVEGWSAEEAAIAVMEREAVEFIEDTADSRAQGETDEEIPFDTGEEDGFSPQSEDPFGDGEGAVEGPARGGTPARGESRSGEQAGSQGKAPKDELKPVDDEVEPSMPAGFSLTLIRPIDKNEIAEAKGEKGWYKAIVVRDRPYSAVDAYRPTRASAIAEALRRAKGKEDEATAPKAGQRPIGTNASGNPVFEDERGVRSFTRDGIRTTEPVGMVPNREGGYSVEVKSGSRNDARFEPASSIFAKNTFITADKVEAARARLREKFRGQISSGIDPEIMLDGMTIAAAYVEAGVRDFVEFAAKMTEDFGEVIQPYLPAFWNGIRSWPGLDTTGMTEATVPAPAAAPAPAPKANAPKVDYFNMKGPDLRTLAATDPAAQAEIDRRAAKRDGKTQDHRAIGAKAFEDGKPRVLPRTPEYMSGDWKKSAEEWFRGWDSANLAAPIEPQSEPEKVTSRFGTPESPNVQALAKAFGDYLVSPANRFPTIIQARKFAAEKFGGETFVAGTPAAKAIDEAIELGVVMAAREIVSVGRRRQRTRTDIFNDLIGLYDRQPNLSVRTSTSVENQAYSTPMPLAYVASRLAQIDQGSSVLEPTAGNGALLIEANPTNTTANELDPDRASNLTSLGFRVSTKDASEGGLRHSGYPVDVVIANPPFGIVKDGTGKTKSFAVDDRYSTNEIDHVIALRALESMKDDGSAVLILGGLNKLASSEEARSDGYNGKAKREFYITLYSLYNVVDHFTVSGDLYAKQGASWPVDVIVIRGKGKSARKVPAADVPRVIRSWEGVKELLNVDYSAARPVGGSPDQSARSNAEGGAPVANADAESAVPSRLGDGGRGGTDAVRSGRDVERQPAAGKPEDRAGSQDAGVGGRRADVAPDLFGEVTPQATPKTAPPVDRAPVDTSARQVPYAPKSGEAGMGTLIPVNMHTAAQASLDALEQRVGNIDEFVARELGYKRADLEKYFGAEQVDGIALAIDNLAKGAALIIGDQTGIGKGRQVAGMLRWAMRNGKTPIFVTEKPGLYADMYRDLVDIGVKNPRIFMTNSGETVPLNDEGDVLKSSGSDLHKAQMRKITAEGLKNHDLIFTTYSQMQTVKGEETERMAFLRAMAGSNGVVVLDESHNAGGQEAGMIDDDTMTRAKFVREIVQLASGVVYSSATYAKRPGVMDLYSKTDMRLAVDDIADLGELIARGGVPMQQIVAAMLAQAGQYVRRERSFDGVTYDTATAPVDKAVYEQFSASIKRIQMFSEGAAQKATKNIAKDLKQEGKSISGDGSTGGAGASSTNFTAVMHNVIGQMLLAIKADVAADLAIDTLKKGEKPVITVANTMEAFISEYADAANLKVGDATRLNFKDVLLRYLERSRQITIKRPFMRKGEKGERHYLTDEELGPLGVREYEDAKAFIKAGDFDKLPVSPIDHIKSKIRAAGYKVGEITGRGMIVDYRADGQGTIAMRGTDEVSTKGKRKAISEFNSGALDALVLNRSGSTGLSLHASEKVKDRRKRHMVIAQPEGNIDTHMQMLGRVHRTGQVITPRYSQLVADVPAEKRPAAVLAKKMASLNANTTASRDSAMTAKDVPDFMNEFGDRVAASVMGDNPDIHDYIGEPLTATKTGYHHEDAMRKVTGRIPLLPLAQQEAIYEMIESEYVAFIEQLEASGENTLEAKTLQLDARLVSRKQVKDAVDSASPFADGVWIDKVDGKLLGKPMTSADMLKDVAKAIGTTVNVTKENAEAVHRSLRRDGEDHSRRLQQNARNAFTAYKRETLDEMANPEARATAETKLSDILVRWQALTDVAKPGQGVKLITNNMGNLYGIVIEVKKTGKSKNPLALGSWKAKIALADASREMTIPFTQLFTPRTKPSEESMSMMELSPVESIGSMPLVKAFDDMQADRREDRYIVTGNLLAGYDLMDAKGSIVNYTDSQGNIRQGILQKRDFDPDAFFQTKPVRFASSDHIIRYLETVGSVVYSTDRNSGIRLVSSGDIRITVDGSKAKGGQYYLNAGVRQAAGSDFVMVSGEMRLAVPPTTAVRVLDALQKAGAVFEATENLDVARQITGQREGMFSLRSFPAPTPEAIAKNAENAAAFAKAVGDFKIDGVEVETSTERARGGSVYVRMNVYELTKSGERKKSPRGPHRFFTARFADHGAYYGAGVSVDPASGNTVEKAIEIARWLASDGTNVSAPTVSESRIDPQSGQQWRATGVMRRHGISAIPYAVGESEVKDGDSRFKRDPAVVQVKMRPAAQAEAVAADLRDRLDKIGLTGVGLKVWQAITAEINGETFGAAGRYLKGTIDLALNGDPFNTLNHEAIHALRDLGLFSPTEWAILERKARDEWMAKYDIATGYGAFTAEQQIEEAIAHAYETWAKGGKVDSILARTFQRIRALLKGIYETLTGMDIRTSDDIFALIAMGDVGSRPVNGQGRDVSMLQSAWHGTPHDFDKFSTDKMGTGEGAQAFGWGIYFAGKKQIAEYYRDKLTSSRSIIFNGEEIDGSDLTNDAPKVLDAIRSNLRWAEGETKSDGSPLPTDFFEKNDSWLEAAMRHELRMFLDELHNRKATIESVMADRQESLVRMNQTFDSDFDRADVQVHQAILNALDGKLTATKPGRLYQVDIPEDSELMLWDAPLSEQPEGVKEKLRAMPQMANMPDDLRVPPTSDGMPSGMSGSGFYAALASALGRDVTDGAGTPRGWGNTGNGNVGRQQNPQAASEALRAAGIPGHKYLAENIGGRKKPRNWIVKVVQSGDETRYQPTDTSTGTSDIAYSTREEAERYIEARRDHFNYVIYDDSRINVLGKFSKKPSETVQTADGPREQMVIPGAERISDRALAERKMQGRKTSTKAQKGVDDLPLFDDGPKQGSLFKLRRAPRTAQEGQQVMQGFIARGQPLDRAMRVPFALLGGVNAKGEWVPGKRLTDRIGGNSLTGAGFGGVVGAGIGTLVAPGVGTVAGSAAGATVGGYLLGAKIDKNGRFGWMRGFTENVRRGLIDRYGLDEAYIEADSRRELEKRAVMQQADGILKVLASKDIGPQEAKVLQAILTGEPVSDVEMTKLAVPIREAIDQLGEEAVSLGLLSAESFERNRGAYLHRVYMKNEIEQGTMAGWVSRKLTSRRKRIIGDELKGRGIFWDVDGARLMKDIPEFQSGARGTPEMGEKFRVIDNVLSPTGDMMTGEARGRTARRIFLPADQDVPLKYVGPEFQDRGVWEVRKTGKKVTLWRDYTKAEREKMGEIVDARYTIGKTFMLMANDLATGRFYKQVAENENWARSTPPATQWRGAEEYSRYWNDAEIGWVKVPDTEISNTGGKKKWGALAGKYVRAEIWRDLNELNIQTTPGTWRKLMTQWKLNKTARNPVVHMNNIMSNLIFMDLADVRAQDLVAGIRAYYAGGKEYEEARDNGAFGADMLSQDLRENVLKPILEEIEAQQKGMATGGFMAKAGMLGIVADKLWTWAKAVDGGMLKAYQAEDEIFRMATYLRRRSMGDNPAAAAKTARDQFLNYDIRAPWVNAARNTVLPFISYTYRAVPKLAEALAHRPWKIAKYMAIAYAANALAYALDDGDDGEDRERAALYDQEQGYTWLGTPRMIRMPFRDGDGLPVFLDVRRWIPGGDIFDSGQGSTALPIPAPLMFGGPLVIAGEFLFNRQAFTGKDITNDLTDDNADMAEDVADWAWKAWAPSALWIPNSWYWDKMANAINGASDGAGRVYSKTEAFLSSIGIKARGLDVENGLSFQTYEFKKVNTALRAKLRAVSRQRERGLISQKAFEAEAADIAEKFSNLEGNLEEFQERAQPKSK